MSWVRYAGLPGDPNHALAQKYLPKGPGAVFSFGLRGRARGGRGVHRRASSCARTWPTSATRARSSSTPARPRTASSPTEALEAAGVLPELVRISVGIEDVDDILYDLDRALG